MTFTGSDGLPYQFDVRGFFEMGRRLSTSDEFMKRNLSKKVRPLLRFIALNWGVAGDGDAPWSVSEADVNAAVHTWGIGDNVLSVQTSLWEVRDGMVSIPSTVLLMRRFWSVKFTRFDEGPVFMFEVDIGKELPLLIVAWQRKETLTVGSE